MTQIRLLLVLTASAAVFTGCGLQAATSSRNTNVSGVFAIGVGASPEKPGYDGVTRGLQLAVERLNADAAGVVRFAVRPPDAGAASVIQIAEQLRNDPSVIGVVGHPESGSSLEAIPIYADEEHANANAVVAISPTASSPRLSGISKWFFRIAPSDNEAARLVARYVVDTVRATSVAIVYRNDSYGRDWTARFSETFTKPTDANDVQTRTVLARIPYLTGITEWTAFALQLKQLAPQVLLFPGDAADATALLRALKANDVKLTFIGGDGTEALARTHEFPEARYAAFFLPEQASTVEGKRFVDSYRGRFNEAPDMFAALSFDAALAIGRVVIAGAHSRSAVRDALERISDATALEGAGGPPCRRAVGVGLVRISDATALEGAGGRIAFNKARDISGRSVVIATVGPAPAGPAPVRPEPTGRVATLPTAAQAKP